MSTSPQPLAELVRAEIDAPGSLESVIDRLREIEPDHDALWRFLELKDVQHRHAYYVKIEHVFLRRLGWRLMRPLFVLALIAAGVSIAQTWTADPTLPLALFLAGAASLYVVLQLFLHRWAWKDEKRLAVVEAEYRDGLRALLEEVER